LDLDLDLDLGQDCRMLLEKYRSSNAITVTLI